jgi:hypothetical protein
MTASRFVLPVLYTLAAAAGGFAGGTLSDDARHILWPAASAAGSRVIAASEFDLVDQSGKLRAKLFLDGPYIPKLTLYDFNDGEGASIAAGVIGGEMILSSRHAPGQEANRAKLSASYNDASLTLVHKDAKVDLEARDWGAFFNLSSGPERKRAIQADVWNDGQLFLLLRDHNGDQRVGLELDKQDTPGVFLYDQKGETRSSLVLDSVGDPNLSLFDARGRPRAVLNFDNDGSPSLSLNDTKQLRAVLGSVHLKNTKTGSVEHRSPSSLVLFGENGRVLWEVP